MSSKSCKYFVYALIVGALVLPIKSGAVDAKEGVISPINGRHLSHKDNLYHDFKDPIITVPQCESFKVRFTVAYSNGKAGTFIVQARPDWAPLGALRFKQLVEEGFYDDSRFFRVISGDYGVWVAQFGMPRDTERYESWRSKLIKDDPILPGNVNRRGTLSFVGEQGTNSRCTQVFINFGHSKSMDGHFNPFAEVYEGMPVVDKVHKTGEAAPTGQGPQFHRIEEGGNTYLDEMFPQLTKIVRVSIIDEKYSGSAAMNSKSYAKNKRVSQHSKIEL